MPGKSPLVSVSRLGTYHLTRIGGVFRVLFCDPSEGVLKFLFGVFLYERWSSKEKKHPRAETRFEPRGECGDAIAEDAVAANVAVRQWGDDRKRGERVNGQRDVVTTVDNYQD